MVTGKARGRSDNEFQNTFSWEKLVLRLRVAVT